MAQTNNGTQTPQTEPERNSATRTMRVKFMETDRKSHTVTYVRRAVGVTGAVRHFALTVKMTPKFWRKVLKAGPLETETMIFLTLEQTWDDDRLCTYATDFSLAPDAVESSLVPNLVTSAG